MTIKISLSVVGMLLAGSAMAGELVLDAPATRIRTKPSSVTLPVAEFKPVDPARTQTINLVPTTGAVPVSIWGYTWAHLCDEDYSVEPNFNCAHIGINSREVLIGSATFGSVAPKPIAWMVGTSQFKMKLSQTELYVPAGRVSIDRKTDGAVMRFEKNGSLKGAIIIDDNGITINGLATSSLSQKMDGRLARVERRLERALRQIEWLKARQR